MCSHFSSDLRESQDRVQGRLGGGLSPFAPRGDANDAAFHWARKLVISSRKSGCSAVFRVSHLEIRHFRLQWNDISYRETRKYEFPSSIERSIISSEFWWCVPLGPE